jgi:hypothetical protein
MYRDMCMFILLHTYGYVYILLSTFFSSQFQGIQMNLYFLFLHIYTYVCVYLSSLNRRPGDVPRVNHSSISLRDILPKLYNGGEDKGVGDKEVHG